SEFRLVPSDGRLIQIDENLFGLEIFFESPGAEFAAEPGLFIAAPRRFNIGGLHVIYPNDSSAQGFHHAERFINIARPNRSSQTIRRIVRDADRVSLALKWIP